MKFAKSQLYVLGIFLVLSCSGNSKNSASSEDIKTQSGQLSNPENSDKNAPTYQSAFAGQTRIEGVKTKTAYKVDIINEDLEKPWGIVNFPDGRFLITSKSGYMNIVSADGKTMTKVEGFPEVYD